MTLTQAWTDSLSLLKPKHCKLFILVTIKSIGEAYKVLLRYWWWLFMVIIGCFAWPYFSAVNFETYRILETASYWSYQVLLFATVLSTRPSLLQKNCEYFRKNMPYFLFLALFLLWLPFSLWPSAISLLYVFIILFYLDSGKRLHWRKYSVKDSDVAMSIFRAIKMFIYNYPLLVVVGFVFFVPLYIFFKYVYLFPLFHNVIAALLLPIPLCLCTNIYIKKLHDQFDLYFSQPK